ncbi:hypothetical protein J4216_03735 [Candidatus Woesearchaeota archaeon]|nr:hypothetical protein [Candidatus Woesearchaeota archaeon]
MKRIEYLKDDTTIEYLVLASDEVSFDEKHRIPDTKRRRTVYELSILGPEGKNSEAGIDNDERYSSISVVAQKIVEDFSKYRIIDHKLLYMSIKTVTDKRRVGSGSLTFCQDGDLASWHRRSLKRKEVEKLRTKIAKIYPLQ